MCVCACVRVCERYVHACMCVHARMHVCVYVCTCASADVYMYVCRWVQRQCGFIDERCLSVSVRRCVCRWLTDDVHCTGAVDELELQELAEAG